MKKALAIILCFLLAACLIAPADLFLATCNDDSDGTYVTYTFWRRIM